MALRRSFWVDEALDCYRRGVFPMAETRDSPEIFLVDPEERGIIPLEGFHVPRRLARALRTGRFQFSVNTDFAGVIRACAAARRDEGQTWINAGIEALYNELHRLGHAHSVEVHCEGAFAGGLYGVALGGAFFGESMFSRRTDASKAALVHLVARLRFGGFRLLDAQFWTDHLGQFGAQTLPRAIFKQRLAAALTGPGDFLALDPNTPADQLLQSIAQTS
jgi:leucyl/phenylalanyl-tRNA---protein transferase